jgi:uncharacterized membrane protein
MPQYEVLAAIIGMAAVTYGARAAGLLLASRLPRGRRTRAWLEQIPSAVLASLVAPAILTGGPAEAIAAAATAAAMIVTRNLFAAMATGVVAVYAGRLLLG